MPADRVGAAIGAGSGTVALVSSRPQPAPSRRTVLRAALVSAGVAAVGGCTITVSGPGSPTASPVTGSKPASGATSAPNTQAGTAADAALVTAATVDEQRLLRLCLATMAAHPRLRSTLRPVVSRQRAHVLRLRRVLTAPSGSPSGTGPTVATRPKQARAALGRAFEAAGRRRRADCLAASSGPLASLLASVAASHAVTAQVLEPPA